MNGWWGSQPPASGGGAALVPAKAGAAMRAALIAPTAAIRPSLTAGGFAVVRRSPVPTGRDDENRPVPDDHRHLCRIEPAKSEPPDQREVLLPDIAVNWLLRA